MYTFGAGGQACGDFAEVEAAYRGTASNFLRAAPEQGASTPDPDVLGPRASREYERAPETRHRTEAFLDMQLEVVGHADIPAAVRAFLTPEVLVETPLSPG